VATFDNDVLDAPETQGILNVQLGIDVLPILSAQRNLSIIASELNLRIRQANVTPNERSVFATDADFTNVGSNFATPLIVTAEDPLHEPVDPNTLAKEGTRIGMGLSFAKAALPNTTRNIILVPAAWAGSGFCADAPLDAHWNPTDSDNSALGNTRLFDRALTRINTTLNDTGGILRGILWHQGESDATDPCAPLYENNLSELVSALRSQIVEDARGSDARGADANIPFVLGTMSRGTDERGDLSEFLPAKQIIDDTHRMLTSFISHSEVTLNDDLVPANGFACGTGSCIHFGSDALREMGIRSYESLTRAATNTPLPTN